jgi:hypothetical protein
LSATIPHIFRTSVVALIVVALVAAGCHPNASIMRSTPGSGRKGAKSRRLPRTFTNSVFHTRRKADMTDERDGTTDDNAVTRSAETVGGLVGSATQAVMDTAQSAAGVAARAAGAAVSTAQALGGAAADVVTGTAHRSGAGRGTQRTVTRTTNESRQAGSRAASEVRQAGRNMRRAARNVGSATRSAVRAAATAGRAATGGTGRGRTTGPVGRSSGGAKRTAARKASTAGRKSASTGRGKSAAGRKGGSRKSAARGGLKKK